MKERWKAFFARRGALPLACYLLAAALWLAWSAGCLAADTLARAQGRLARQDIPVEGFHLVGVLPVGDGTGVYTTDSMDPQMILEDVSDRVVRTLSYAADFAGGEPREMCLYYTTRVGQDYSQDRRVFASQTAPGRYVYTLPRGRIVALRLDPCSPEEGVSLQLSFPGRFVTLNAEDTLPWAWRYFVPSWYQLFCLVLYPGLAAAALDWLRALRRRGQA